MSCLSRAVVAGAVAFASLTLHGCGGDTTTTTTIPKTGTTTVTTTTTTFSCPDAGSPEADAVNAIYMGFEPGTTKENFGVTIRFIQESHGTDGRWYYCHHGCFQGYCDCRVSASLLNHKMMINKTASGSFPEGTLGAYIGVIFNQTTVETTLAKCYYPYDGGTDMRYNMGCGCGMPDGHETCDDPQSAFKSIDPLTGKPMTSKSKDVHDCHCGDGARAGDPKKKSDAQCYWTGPAFFANDSMSVNELPTMVSKRMRDQDESSSSVETTFWNEVVIDGVVMEKEMEKDPNSVVTAVVWLKQGNNADKQAYQSAQAFSQWFQSSGGFKTAPPIVAFDMSVNVAQCGPFKKATPDDASITV